MSKIKLFTNCYKKDQIDNISFGSDLWDNTKNEFPELGEYPVFREVFNSELTKNVNYWGIVSPKFVEKTNMTAQYFKDWIETQLPSPIPLNLEKDPDIDSDKLFPTVYFVNPVPIVESLFPSTIYHGNNCHPGLAALINRVLIRMGYSIDLNSLYMDYNTFSLCNYFVGNRIFWHYYLSFVDNFIKEAKNNFEDNNLMFNISAQYGRNSALSYYPFAVERLFSIFLHLPYNTLYNSTSFPVYIKAIPFIYSNEQLIQKTKLDENVVAELKALSSIKYATVSGKNPDLINSYMLFRNQIARRNPYLFQME